MISCDAVLTSAATTGCQSLQVHYVDCGEPYVQNGYVTGDLMPDAMHPNGPGASRYERFLEPMCTL